MLLSGGLLANLPPRDDFVVFDFDFDFGFVWFLAFWGGLFWC